VLAFVFQGARFLRHFRDGLVAMGLKQLPRVTLNVDCLHISLLFTQAHDPAPAGNDTALASRRPSSGGGHAGFDGANSASSLSVNTRLRVRKRRPSGASSE